MSSLEVVSVQPQVSSPEVFPFEPTSLSLTERLMTFQRAMTTDEVADLLHVSKLTVLRKAKRGTIPCFKVGRLFRFDPRTLAGWLRKRGVQ